MTRGAPRRGLRARPCRAVRGDRAARHVRARRVRERLGTGGKAGGGHRPPEDQGGERDAGERAAFGCGETSRRAGTVKKQTDAKVAKESSKRRVPEYALSIASDSASVEIVVQMPELRGRYGVRGSRHERDRAFADFSEYALAVTLPKRANPEGATAKFSSKRKTLTIILPTVPVR